MSLYAGDISSQIMSGQIVVNPDGSFVTKQSIVKPQTTFNPSLSDLGLKEIQSISEEKTRNAMLEEEAKKASGRYIIIKDTNLMKEGEQAYSSLVGLYKRTIVVKPLKVGDIIDIVKSGKGGIISPHYLSLQDGTYINAVDAKREDSNLLETKNLAQNSQTLQQSFFQKHKTHLLLLGGVVLAYFAYKKIKK